MPNFILRLFANLALALPMTGLLAAPTVAMPLDFFAEFFRNHGLLDLRNRPQWRVIRGGSREYLKPLAAPFANRIHLRTPVVRVRRFAAAGDCTACLCAAVGRSVAAAGRAFAGDGAQGRQFRPSFSIR